MSDFIEAPRLPAQRGTAVLARDFESGVLSSAYPYHLGFSRDSRGVPSTCGSATCTMVTGLNVLHGQPNISDSTAPYEDLIGSSTGSESIAWADWIEFTKRLLQKQDADPKPTPNAAAKLRVDRLTYIQAVFGLSMQAMADILGVTRQGLYKWLDVTKDISLQEANQHRLAVVERLVAQWRERSNAPLGSLVNMPLTNGFTVLDMLKGSLDERAIINAFDKLAAMLDTKPKTLGQRMAESGFKRRPSTRSLPSDE